MRVRTEHWQLLLGICEKNPELITNKFNGPDGKAKGHALWQSVTQKLNSLGFGEKTTEEWRRALVDWKSKTKSKAAKIKKENGKTGGGPGEYTPLSDLENRLIQIMRKRAVDGDEVPEMGFGKVTVIPVQPEDKTYEEVTDHNYWEKVDSPTCSLESTLETTVTGEPSTSSLERKLAGPKRGNKRVRPRDTERLSQKLLNVNEESLQLLREISNNTGSMADSLKSMTAVIEQYFNGI